MAFIVAWRKHLSFVGIFPLHQDPSETARCKIVHLEVFKGDISYSAYSVE